MSSSEVSVSQPESSTISVAEGKPFLPDRIDAYLACACFVLGFLFIRWVFLSWAGWGVSLFTALYICTVMLYRHYKGKKITGEAWVWLAVLVALGLSFSLWQGNGVFSLRALLLLGTALYWVQLATNMTLCDGTSDWLPLDLLRGIFSVPLKNLGAQSRSLVVLGRQGRRLPSNFWSIGLGVLLFIVVISVVGPLLVVADAGGFGVLLGRITTLTAWLPRVDAVLLVQMILSIPTAAYIFGLLATSIHGRQSDIHSVERAEKSVNAFRILPEPTVLTMLVLLNGLYLIFILTQLPYFFSAFLGAVPAGWDSYAAFARRGFFELCFIAMINLAVLAGAHLGITITKRHSIILKVLSSLLAVLTLFLIATAFSKVILYISVFGMTVPRLLPSVFLVFLAVVFGGMIMRQRKQFSIMRLATFVGVVLLCLLCVLNTDGLVVNYNANRYLGGSLESFDTAVLYRAGVAGVAAALRLYKETEDVHLRERLLEYLNFAKRHSAYTAGTMRDTLQHALARRKLAAAAERGFR